jgi:hypothetical protein
LFPGRDNINSAILISLAQNYQNKAMNIASGQRDNASIEQLEAALEAKADIADALTAAVRTKLNKANRRMSNEENEILTQEGGA